MSRETIEAIDAAVRAHYADVLAKIDAEVNPVTTGWVLVAEIQTLEDGDILWDNDYTTGETTSPNTALGLGTWLADNLRGIQATSDVDDDE